MYAYAEKLMNIQFVSGGLFSCSLVLDGIHEYIIYEERISWLNF